MKTLLLTAAAFVAGLRNAVFTRSLLSRTAVSGSPTVISASFSPALRSTSTETG